MVLFFSSGVGWGSCSTTVSSSSGSTGSSIGSMLCSIDKLLSSFIIVNLKLKVSRPSIHERAILPVGGHKGHGLSIMVEILAGALTGGHCSNPKHAGFLANNMFSLLMDPNLMGAGAQFGDELAALEDWIKSSAPAADTSGEILLPGEPEQRTRADRLANGIPIDDETYRQLIDAVETARARLTTRIDGGPGGT